MADFEEHIIEGKKLRVIISPHFAGGFNVHTEPKGKVNLFPRLGTDGRTFVGHHPTASDAHRHGLTIIGKFDTYQRNVGRPARKPKKYR